MSATATALATRFHVGLHVSDRHRSVRFYRTLLGVAPVRDLDDYVRFELSDPPVVLVLIPAGQSAGGALNHLGLRMPDSAGLVEVQRRLEEAGIATQRQEGVECCYARQTKFWVTDPDRNLWEIYTVEEDIDHSGFDGPPLPDSSLPETVWEHRITEAVPEHIPLGDASADEVRLEGTFNADHEMASLASLLAECRRVLRPGRRLAVHALTSDQPFPGTPSLPGLASLVRRVPTWGELAVALAQAGFAGVFFEKLGDIHCFCVNGVELRETRLHAWRPNEVESAALCDVLYKGPFERVKDDDGTVYPRGERVTVTAHTAERLRHATAAGQFLFFPDRTTNVDGVVRRGPFPAT
jgi:catechol 2,3-dioxygenase-like lactoylglutathione lyase family enzyme